MSLIKLNQIYEIIGVLSYMPIAHEENEIEDHFIDLSVQFPTTLVPRIHCLSLRKLSDFELEKKLLSQLSLKYPNNSFNLIESRNRFLEILKKLTLNDELSAQYLFFGILNNISTQKPEFIENLKKIVLNIYKCSKLRFQITETLSLTFPQLLAKLCSKIALKSIYFPLEINDLEKHHYSSSKNYENNSLEIGKLQITSSTVICVDETTMSAGKLTEKGIKNIQALNDLLESQTLSFDFSYHDLKVPCECNAIVCSEGKSFLKTNINVIFSYKNFNKIKTFYQ